MERARECARERARECARERARECARECARERAREANYEFAMCCLRGDLPAAKRMANLYVIDARAFGNSALHYAYAMDSYALRQACRKGHSDVVRWLVGRFGAPKGIEPSVHMANVHGYPAIAKWLAKHRYAA